MGELHFYYQGELFDFVVEYVEPSVLDDGRVVCLGGVGDTPPEGFTWIEEYYPFLAILADPEEPEHVAWKEWGAYEGYAPFDLEATNERLAVWKTYVRTDQRAGAPVPVITENDLCFETFIDDMGMQHLSYQTIRNHGDNVSYFVKTYLVERNLSVGKGIELVPEYLDEPLVVGNRYITVARYKKILVSIRKFYACMVDYGKVNKWAYEKMVKIIKANQDLWIAHVEELNRK